ncbi:MAG: DUF3369 domain-containing protein [Gammaproteobacteria bacterium]|nr:DUF3369 domain-containing protein [Gammaproteobacteria bacterium]
MTDDDEFLFSDEDDELDVELISLVRPWKILIVDDEHSIHDITKLALRGIKYQHRDVEFFHAYSAQECIEHLMEHPDTALILLDVVMESEHAGLDAVKHIRYDLCNQFVRIILRTGQPGQAPEREVILNYDINDYKEKTELTSKKLFTSVISALRSFEDIIRLEKNRQGLEKIIDATSGIFKEKNLEALFNGILMQVLSIVGLTDDDYKKSTSSFMAVFDNLDEKNHVAEMAVFSGTGRFDNLYGKFLAEVVDPNIVQTLQDATSNEHNVYSTEQFIVYVKNNSLIYIETVKELDEIDQNLLDIFCANVGIAYENSHLNHELVETQKEIIITLGATAEFRSKETGQHVIRVAEMSKHLAMLIGLPIDEAEILRLASPMHDIGKIAVPDQILLKETKLSEEEFEIMKNHTSIGYEIFKKSKRPILKAAAIIPIIAMTANPMKGEREKCLEVGMNDYLTKPIKQKIFKWS